MPHKVAAEDGEQGKVPHPHAVCVLVPLPFVREVALEVLGRQREVLQVMVCEHLGGGRTAQSCELLAGAMALNE